MATERFDIEVRDLVAKTIRTELKAIGAEARSTHETVKQLNAEIDAGARRAASSAQQAAVQTTRAAGETAAAQARVSAETARATAAQTKATEAQTRGAIAAARLAQAQAKAAEAQSKANIAYLAEEAALNRAVAAEQRATSSKDRLAAASTRQAAAAERELRITTGNVQPGTGAAIGGTAGSRETVANAARIMNQTSMPAPAVSPQQARDVENFKRQLQGLRNELDPAAASTAAFAVKQDLLNRGLETGIITAAEHKAATSALKKAEEEAAAAFVKAGGGAHLGSMQVREMIVVMRELARGDITRLPGSLTILAQRFGLLNGVSIGMLAAFGGVAAVLGTLAFAAEQGEAESNKLANAISLSGNAAGFTSQKFEDMASKVADSSRSSIGSTKELLLGIVGNAHFTSDEMGKLVGDAQLLGRATGQSADDVLSNFEKMSDGPTKFAETFYDQFSGVITPTLVDHVRQLEATGQTYEATKQLVDGITEGLAKNQVEQTGYIIRAWRAVASAVSEAWDALKGIGTVSTTAQQLADVNRQIATAHTVIPGIGDISSPDQLAALEARRAALVKQVAAEKAAADATAAHTREQRLQEQGVQALNGTYGRLIDNSARLTNDTKKLQNTMRNAVGWGSVAEPSVHFEQVLAQAAKSNDANVRNMAANWTKALDKLKKQDMPAQWKADNKHPKKGRTPWDRAGAFEEDTTHLDDEIKSLGDYGQALTEANMLEQLSAKYRKHNMDLTGPEVALLKERIHTLEEGKRVQQAMTAADEAANGPARAYDATMTALSEMLAKGKIDQAEFTRQVYLAEEAYKSATDPLYQMNKELEKNAQLVGHFGKDLDVRQFIQQMEEAAKAQGRSIYQRTGGAANDNGAIVVTGSRRMTSEASSALAEFKRQQQEKEQTSAFEAIDPRKKQLDTSSPNYILDHYKELYASIQRFREEDVANEAEATERKKNLDRAYADARLATMSSVLGQLATLQDSHSRTVAAIGKAAAVAQATIDGIRAVQAALAGPPGPPWSFAIAGATAAMTAVNVAKIAGIGFQSGGYTGNGYEGDIAGPAHKQEYIFDASATARIGVPALDALRRGTLAPASSNDNSRSSRVTVHQHPGTVVEVRERTDGEIEVIAQRVTRAVAPRAVADDIRSNPNSHTSKAISGSFGLKRNR